MARRAASVTPVATGLASDGRGRYWMTERPTAPAVGTATNPPGDDTRTPRATPPLAGPGLINSDCCMVRVRRGGTTHRGEWVARIVTTGFAGRPGRLVQWARARACGREMSAVLTPPHDN